MNRQSLRNDSAPLRAHRNPMTTVGIVLLMVCFLITAPLKTAAADEDKNSNTTELEKIEMLSFAQLMALPPGARAEYLQAIRNMLVEVSKIPNAVDGRFIADEEPNANQFTAILDAFFPLLVNPTLADDSTHPCGTTEMEIRDANSNIKICGQNKNAHLICETPYVEFKFKGDSLGYCISPDRYQKLNADAKEKIDLNRDSLNSIQQSALNSKAIKEREIKAQQKLAETPLAQPATDPKTGQPLKTFGDLAGVTPKTIASEKKEVAKEQKIAKDADKMALDHDGSKDSEEVRTAAKAKGDIIDNEKDLAKSGITCVKKSEKGSSKWNLAAAKYRQEPKNLCIYAGFVKSYNDDRTSEIKNSRCIPKTSVSFTTSSNKDLKISCSKNGEILCNPLIFGVEKIENDAGVGICVKKGAGATAACNDKAAPEPTQKKSSSAPAPDKTTDGKIPASKFVDTLAHGLDSAWGKFQSAVVDSCNSSGFRSLHCGECQVIAQRLKAAKPKAQPGSTSPTLDDPLDSGKSDPNHLRVF